MKNITVSVPDEMYRKARIRAAEKGTSVSALVRQFLSQMAEPDEKEERNRHLLETMEAIRSANPDFTATDLLSRDELHDRDALRLEHSQKRDPKR